MVIVSIIIKPNNNANTIRWKNTTTQSQQINSNKQNKQTTSVKTRSVKYRVHIY